MDDIARHINADPYWGSTRPQYDTLIVPEQSWKAKFIQKFTDGMDSENDYYDAQLTEPKPHKLIEFITEVYTRAFALGHAAALKEAVGCVPEEYTGNNDPTDEWDQGRVYERNSCRAATIERLRELQK